MDWYDGQADARRVRQEIRRMVSAASGSLPDSITERLVEPSSEHLFNPRTHATLVLPEDSRSKTPDQQRSIASYLYDSLQSRDYWRDNPEIELRVLDLAEKGQLVETWAVLAMIINGQEQEALDWLGIEYSVAETFTWGSSEPVHREVIVMRTPEDGVTSSTQERIMARWNKLIEAGNPVASHPHVSQAIIEALSEFRHEVALLILAHIENEDHNEAARHIAAVSGLSRDSRKRLARGFHRDFIVARSEEREAMESAKKTKSTTPKSLVEKLEEKLSVTDELTEPEADPLDRVLDLKAQMEGLDQEKEARVKLASRARRDCLVVAIGAGVGSILVSSTLLTVLLVIAALIFLVGVLNPINSHPKVEEITEQKGRLQKKLDTATEEWLEAEGLS